MSSLRSQARESLTHFLLREHITVSVNKSWIDTSEAGVVRARGPSSYKMGVSTRSKTVMAKEVTKKSDNKMASMRELTEENIRVEDKVYSAHVLAAMHPGGSLFVKAFAGRDATEPFLTYHRRRFPHSRMTQALQFVDPKVRVDAEVSQDFLELCDRVDKVLPRMSSFAPWSYYLKAIFLLSMAMGLELYMHWKAEYVWYISALIGWLYALIGLAVQHDANHGALSRRPWVNRVWGMSQNWIGGSAVSWIHQHVVQHHVHTNDVVNDPDIEGRTVIRLNPLKPLLKFQATQHIYFFVLILGYGFSVIFHSFSTMVEGINYTPVSPLLQKHRVVECLLSLFFFTRWIAIPLYQVPALTTLLHCAPMPMVAGWWLSFFFTLSHNFDGVQQLQADQQPTSLLYRQVATTSNVGGKWLCFLNGGLNYQIEHHLFPRMHHGHYPTVAPVVRDFCVEKGIPYVHFDGVWDNAKACAAHLFDMGTNDTPKSFRQTSKQLVN